jgi:hypothetical protein
MKTNNILLLLLVSTNLLYAHTTRQSKIAFDETYRQRQFLIDVLYEHKAG